MTTPREATVADVAAGLRAALDALAAAMTVGDADAVLAVEPALQVAAGGQTGAMTSVAPADRDLVRQDLIAARAALARCRALGADDFRPHSNSQRFAKCGESRPGPLRCTARAHRTATNTVRRC